MKTFTVTSVGNISRERVLCHTFIFINPFQNKKDMSSLAGVYSIVSISSQHTWSLSSHTAGPHSPETQSVLSSVAT